MILGSQTTTTLTLFSLISIVILSVVYFFLITEKVNKVIVAILGAVTLIFLQVFRTAEQSSQEGAFWFINKNLDILGFVLGMMVLIGIVKESGFFEAMAIWLVKKVKGQPAALLIVFGYLTLLMTIFFSNIPTILILTPVLIVLIRELKLPYMPYFFIMITMANIGGATTPISDPTTYYQAKTVGLGFLEVVKNSGSMVFVLSIVSSFYTYFVFRKDLKKVTVSPKDVSAFDPKSAIQNKRILKLGLPLLFLTIALMVLKDTIRRKTGITLENATITIAASFLGILLFHKEPNMIFKKIVDWEILAFFSGLFVIVGALESTHVIEKLSEILLVLTGGDLRSLIVYISMGSGLLSTFIDNVPYNITMVSAIQEMAQKGIYVYPLWWALNLGTSIGGAGSPIAAACNVLAFSQAGREGFHVRFVKYLLIAFPLVVINTAIVSTILTLTYIK